MQQAGRAYLFRQGYRTVGEGHHATVVRFLKMALDADHSDTLAVMNRMRRKRNRATYGTAGLISLNEASEAVSTAIEFVGVVGQAVAD